MEQTERLMDIGARLAALQEAEGEIDVETFKDTLEGLEGEFGDKIRRCILVKEQYMEEVARMNTISLAYTNRIARVRASADHLESYVIGEMMNAKLDTVETPEIRVKLKVTKSVEITDDEAIPSQLKTTYAPVTTTKNPSPDKRAIMTQLTAGETVPGCRIKHTHKLTYVMTKTKEVDDVGTE